MNQPRFMHVDMDAFNFTDDEWEAVSDYYQALFCIVLADAQTGRGGPRCGLALMATLADLFCMTIEKAIQTGLIAPAHVDVFRAAFSKVLPRLQ